MATKQQIREDITKIIQEGVLTQVLPFTSSDDTPITITAENYQTIVSGGQTEVGTAAEGEQTIIYEQDFQTAKNEFNRFVDDIVDCYKNVEVVGGYQNSPYATFGTTAGDGISYSFSDGTQVSLDDAKITQNIGAVYSFDCTTSTLQLEDALVAITQFQSLNLTSTQIDPTQAQEILDTTIFELIGQQTTKQDRINQFFQDYTNLRSGETPTDDDGDGIADNDYDINNDISAQNPEGSIVRLDKNAGDVNEDQTLEWLRDDLNRYFFDDVVDEGLPTYQERSSGYLKFREMNQAIIIRNTENQQVIPDTWIGDGFTITMWVKFKDKVSSGTLFNYGNPTSTTQTPFGFKLDTFILSPDSPTGITGNPTFQELSGYESVIGPDNPNGELFKNTNEERFVRLIVYDGSAQRTFDSHTANPHIEKQESTPFVGADGFEGSNLLSMFNNTRVPTDFNEWYFIVATYDPLNDETIDDTNKNLPLYWTGNLTNPTDPTSTTHDSGLGNKCKVEIISKTDLLRARGYKTQ